MTPTAFITDYSPLYIIPCLLLGGLYAWLLYQKGGPWSRSINYLLAGLRALLVSLIAILLLGIAVKQTQNEYEDPTWVFAFDDSQSLPLLNDSSQLQQTTQALHKLQTQLEQKGYQTQIERLSESDPTEVIAYTHPTTNLSSFLQKIESTYEGTHLAGVVMFSDGIFNLGTTPDARPYRYTLHTLGIGDTSARRDLILQDVQANRLAYLGNRFPMVAEIIQNGFANQTVEVQLLQDQKIIDQQSLTFGTAPQERKEIRFLAEAKKEGMQRFVVRLVPKEGEFTTENNSRNVYVEVLSNKQKVLLAAAVPHPDLKALRATLEQNENYDIDLMIPDIFPLKPNQDYDLIIFHQFPHQKRRGQAVFEQLLRQPTAQAFVIGSDTDLNALNALKRGLSIRQMGVEQDQVIPSFNPNFNKFLFGQEQRGVFERYPPVRVPFGDYTLTGSGQVLLYQRVGSIQTKRPLLAVNETEEARTGFFVGEGLWQWRLQEYALLSEQKSFDELMSKWVQYLVTRRDKRRFRVTPTAPEFSTSETVRLDIETYNEIYEPIVGQKINLVIKNESGESKDYDFTNATERFRYLIQGLPEGVYSYTATARFEDNTQHSDKGQFTVRRLALESLRTQADFGLLRRLAQDNNGYFFRAEQVSALADSLLAKDPIQRFYTTTVKSDILNLPWLLVLLLTLASLEWFLRKYHGGY